VPLGAGPTGRLGVPIVEGRGGLGVFGVSIGGERVPDREVDAFPRRRERRIFHDLEDVHYGTSRVF
jgi:hypothetical protein